MLTKESTVVSFHTDTSYSNNWTDISRWKVPTRNLYFFWTTVESRARRIRGNQQPGLVPFRFLLRSCKVTFYHWRRPRFLVLTSRCWNAFLGTVVLRLECAIESWKKLVKNTDAWSPPWHMLNQEVLAGAQVSVSLKCPGGADALWWRSRGLGGGRDCGGCLSSVTIRTSLDCLSGFRAAWPDGGKQELCSPTALFQYHLHRLPALRSAACDLPVLHLRSSPSVKSITSNSFLGG